MLKRTLTALAMVAMVGMVATPATADLLVPDQVFEATTSQVQEPSGSSARA